MIAGNTISFSITDGGLGYYDLKLPTGTIVDLGGPDVGGGGARIQMLSEWELLALAFLMGPLKREAYDCARRRGSGWY